jgi:hypothetical protein
MSEREVAVILRALGRIEGKLEAVAAEQARVAQSVLVTDSRVARLEIHKASVMGWAAGAAAVVATIVSFVWRLVGVIH